MRRALLALLLAVPLVATGGTAKAATCTDQQVTVVVQYLGVAPDRRHALGRPTDSLADGAIACRSFTRGTRIAVGNELHRSNAQANNQTGR